MKIRVAKQGTALWTTAAVAVKKKYRIAYEAQVEPNPENFVVAIDDAQRILACAGITFAGPTPLFSEQYLEKPIESVIHDTWGVEYFRNEIAEIGNLISNDISASASVIKLVPLLAWCMGARALLCTVTTKVAGLLKNYDIQFEPICEADPARVAGAGHAWGSYYANRPVTGLIHVADHRALLRHMTTSMDFISRSQADQLETVS
ncbi:thermostable hemolysin [Burkholderia plantarii]|uniref:thermostable hemolysin n=1 Tax=Burkholderia plantarii TaxID=41899 RepID=UPI0018DDBABB|nr:thermostable hemolysin [Burkholderia plantarii]MBI0329795.1 thermostable hemolysin [Burkholderia plantarii]